jgi:BASS family bile acid:Na+ symporter
VLNLLTNLFPAWVTLGAVLALIRPGWFTWFSGPLIPWTLALVMLGMGITLRLEDFKAVLRLPRAVAIGFVGQYTIMPAAGWGVAKALDLPPQFAAGLILVACCPGGTASNVVTFLAHGNVPLSVLMTMCSTFAAVFMTPFLTQWLAGTVVPVDALGLLVSTAQVVLLPLVVGLLLVRYAPRFVKLALSAAPLVSVLGVTLIVASIIGTSANEILQGAGQLVLAVFLLHAFGFGLGYLLARLLGQSVTTCRTVSIEVGMQNSGLGAALAKKHFIDPASGISLAAVPCAISSVFHSVIGSALAGWWRLRPALDETKGPRT